MQTIGRDDNSENTTFPGFMDAIREAVSGTVRTVVMACQLGGEKKIASKPIRTRKETSFENRSIDSLEGVAAEVVMSNAPAPSSQNRAGIP